MPQPSPTTEGLRAAFRRPSVVAAEITWRWVFGAAVLTLLTASFFEFLDILPVSKADLLFLRSNQPFLVSQAIGHILHGTANRVVVSLLIMTTALAALWIFIASLGRAATVKSLLDYFEFPVTGAAEEKRGRFGSLAGLNFLRVALALAAMLAMIAAGIIAGFASSDKNPQPGLVFLLFIPLAGLVALLWSSLNWFLSVAPIFVVGETCDTFGSLGATLDFCRKHPGPIFWSSTAFGVIHLVLFVGASSVVAVPLAFLGVLPAGVVFAAIGLLTLMYFAIVDFFFTGRMAAYIAILRTPNTPIAQTIYPKPVPSPPVMGVSHPVPAIWDSLSDDIASDVPGESEQTPAEQGTSDRLTRGQASEDDILSDVPVVEPPDGSS